MFLALWCPKPKDSLSADDVETFTKAVADAPTCCQKFEHLATCVDDGIAHCADWIARDGADTGHGKSPSIEQVKALLQSFFVKLDEEKKGFVDYLLAASVAKDLCKVLDKALVGLGPAASVSAAKALEFCGAEQERIIELMSRLLGLSEKLESFSSAAIIKDTATSILEAGNAIVARCQDLARLSISGKGDTVISKLTNSGQDWKKGLSPKASWAEVCTKAETLVDKQGEKLHGLLQEAKEARLASCC